MPKGSVPTAPSPSPTISAAIRAPRFSRRSVRQTPVFIRFSTVAGERGAADAERDIRGFAVKFYTEEGNWDLVGNNTPVFFFRDPLRFPDLNHAVKRDPRTGLRSADNNWDFWTLLPEALHQVTIVMSDRGIPKSYRHMHGFGSHTFSLINARNERVWVKFHFLTQQGIENLTDAEAGSLIGNDRESHLRDLYDSIEVGDFPRWTLFIQLMTEEQARHHQHNPFDLTKTWPKKDYPLIEVGVLELNRNPENHFRRSRAVGVFPCQCRTRHRLLAGQDAAGATVLLRRYPALPARRQLQPHPGECAEMSVPLLSPGRLHADRRQPRRHALLYPNSADEWANRPDFSEPPLDITGPAQRWDHRVDEDHWEQPGHLFRS